LSDGLQAGSGRKIKMQEGSEMGFTKMEIISNPRIIVVVRGGVVNGICSNLEAADVSILDYDEYESGMSRERQREFKILSKEANKLTAIY
jgi:hypothetical protein